MDKLEKTTADNLVKTTADKSSENTTNTILHFIDSHQDQIMLNKIQWLLAHQDNTVTAALTMVMT